MGDSVTGEEVPNEEIAKRYILDKENFIERPRRTWRRSRSNPREPSRSTSS
jgi:hypothetical protein